MVCNNRKVSSLFYSLAEHGSFRVSYLYLYLYLYPYNTPLQIILQPPNKSHIYSHNLNYIHPTKHTQKKTTLKTCTPD